MLRAMRHGCACFCMCVCTCVSICVCISACLSEFACLRVHPGEETTVQRVAAARADHVPIVMEWGQDLRAHQAKEGPAFALLTPTSFQPRSLFFP